MFPMMTKIKFNQGVATSSGVYPRNYSVALPDSEATKFLSAGIASIVEPDTEPASTDINTRAKRVKKPAETR